MSTRRLVLVADADADTRSLYRYCLHSTDCYVVEAIDGCEALSKAFDHPPTLLITELWLPVLDGYAVCERLRRKPTTAETPILVATTETRAGELDRARQAGASAVFRKAVDLPHLLIETERLLAESGEVRARAVGARARAADVLAQAVARLERAAALRSEHPQRGTLTRTRRRFTTTTLSVPPPVLVCPLCDRPLIYEDGDAENMNGHVTEPRDVFRCETGCGTFEYWRRTRKLRRIT